jgi:hypothetical protein
MARSVPEIARHIKIHTRHNILISKILYPDIPGAPDIITFTAITIKLTKPYKKKACYIKPFTTLHASAGTCSIEHHMGH